MFPYAGPGSNCHQSQKKCGYLLAILIGLLITGSGSKELLIRAKPGGIWSQSERIDFLAHFYRCALRLFASRLFVEILLWLDLACGRPALQGVHVDVLW